MSDVSTLQPEGWNGSGPVPRPTPRSLVRWRPAKKSHPTSRPARVLRPAPTPDRAQTEPLQSAHQSGDMPDQFAQFGGGFLPPRSSELKRLTLRFVRGELVDEPEAVGSGATGPNTAAPPGSIPTFARQSPLSATARKAILTVTVGDHRSPPCPCWNVAAACGDGRAATCSRWRRHGDDAAATGRRRRACAALG